MKSSLILFSFLVSTVLFFSCNQSPKEFRIDFPKGWTRIDTQFENKNATVFVSHSDTMMYLNPIINIVPANIGQKSHLDFFNDTKDYLSKSLLRVKFIDEGSIETKYGTCLWYSYLNSSKEPYRELIYYSLLDGRISYNITAGAFVGGIDYYRQTFDNMVQSFRTE